MQKHFDVSSPSSVRILLFSFRGRRWEMRGAEMGGTFLKGKLMPCFEADERRAENSSASVESQWPSYAFLCLLLQILTYAKVACFRVAYLVPVMRLIVGGSSIDVKFLPVQPSFHCPHSFLLTSFSLGSDNFLSDLVCFPHFCDLIFLTLNPTLLTQLVSTNELDFLFLNWICWAWYVISGHAWPSGLLGQWCPPTSAAVIQYRLQSQGPRVASCQSICIYDDIITWWELVSENMLRYF